MRVTVQAGLGLALMGGLLTAACGDESRADRAIDSPGGAGVCRGRARRRRRGARPAPGRRRGAGTGGAPGTGGARPSGESPPPPAGAIRLIAPLSGGLVVDESADGPLAGGRRVGAVTVELCADRACTAIVQQNRGDREQRDGDGRARRGPHLLARGAGTATSATWEAFIPHRTAAPSAALATRPDYDGDGFGDFVLDNRVLLGGPSGYARSFPLPGPTPAADATFFVQAGDLNGDGFGDVLPARRLGRADAVRDSGPDAPLRRAHRLHRGDATTSAMPYGPIYSAGPAGDIDADGYADSCSRPASPP